MVKGEAGDATPFRAIRGRESSEMPWRRMTSSAVTDPVWPRRIARISSGVCRRFRSGVGPSGHAAGWDPTRLDGTQSGGNVTPTSERALIRSCFHCRFNPAQAKWPSLTALLVGER
jgi:hypothetical protein